MSKSPVKTLQYLCLIIKNYLAGIMRKTTTARCVRGTKTHLLFPFLTIKGQRIEPKKAVEVLLVLLGSRYTFLTTAFEFVTDR